MKTYSPKPEHIERHWYVLDAEGQVLGRLATHAATLLRGKHKPIFAPHMDTGDHVIVVNADKVELTGEKAATKIAYRHSGHPGGIRATTYDRLLAERPVFAVEKAIRGMLPKNRLGRAMIRKLHVLAGPDHPHAAQKPTALAADERPAWGGLPARPEAATRPATRPASTPTPAGEPAAEIGSTRPAPARTKKSPAKSTARKSTARKAPAKTTALKTTEKTTGTSTAKRSTAKRSSTRGPTPKESG